MKARRHQRAFLHGMVLLELMVALFVFVTVAFALVLALDAGMKAGAQRNEFATVIRGIGNRLTLLHQGSISPTDKDLPDDGSGVSYHLEVRPEQLQDQKKQPLPNIYRATITAKWTSNGQPEDRSISELLYQP